jgi:hypothetical protein
MDIQPLASAIERALAQAAALCERLREARAAPPAEALARLHETLLEAKDRCSAIRQQMSELEALLVSQDQVSRERGMYWRFIGDKKIGGPYCPQCYEQQGELIPMRYHPGAIGHYPQAPWYECERCGKRFEP